jgi:hypothetical protein
LIFYYFLWALISIGKKLHSYVMDRLPEYTNLEDKYTLLCKLAILGHSLFMSWIDIMHLLLGLKKVRLNKPLELNLWNDCLLELDSETSLSLILVSWFPNLPKLTSNSSLRLHIKINALLCCDLPYVQYTKT